MLKFHALPSYKSNCQQELQIIEVGGINFLQIHGFPFQDLLFFSPSSGDEELFEGIQKKAKLDPASIIQTENNPFIKRIANEMYMNFPICFDLQFLQYVDFSNIDVLLLSNFRDLFLLPYICRIGNFNGQIYAVQPLMSLGNLVIKEFQTQVEKRIKQYCVKPSYYLESQAYEQFEELHNLNMQEFVEMFSLKDWEVASRKVQNLSFGQVIGLHCKTANHTMSFTPLQDGMHIGSTFWKFQVGNAFKFAVVKELSLNDQRHCLAVDRSHFDDLDLCILGSGMSHLPTKSAIPTLIENTARNLTQGRNVILPIFDLTMLLDLQSIMLNQFYMAVQIYVISETAFPFIQVNLPHYFKLANSEVCYLNSSLQKKIFQETPQNPFHQLYAMKEGKLTFAASTEELKVFFFKRFKNTKQSIFTVSNMLRQSTPSLFFIYDSSLRFKESAELFETLESIFTPITQQQQQISMSIILTDPDFQGEKVLGHIKNIYRAQIDYIPIVFRASAEQSIDFLLKTGCKDILVPDTTILPIKSSRIKQYAYGRQNSVDITKLVLPANISGSGTEKNLFGLVKIESCSLKPGQGEDVLINKATFPIPDIYSVPKEHFDRNLENLYESLRGLLKYRACSMRQNEESTLMTFGDSDVMLNFTSDLIQICTKDGNTSSIEKLILDELHLQVI